MKSAVSESVVEGSVDPTVDHRVQTSSSRADDAVRISIGILAYNEESAIAETIRSIGEQTLVAHLPPMWSVEVVCVANGCRDRTVQVAEQAFRDLRVARPSPRLEGRVENLERPSKENAWNEFVHRLSRRDADFLIMMDGDVRLLESNSLRSMIDMLCQHPRAHACGATTVKHLHLKSKPSLLERISLAATDIRRHAMPTRFAGCLYAARSQACRRFRLPTIMRGEDGFLLAMWGTDFFTVPVNHTDPTRVVSSPDAKVLFEAYTSPRAVLKNLRRRAVGLTINTMLYDRLWAESTPREDAGALLLRWHREDPTWDQKYLQQKIRERGKWIPAGGSFWRWASPSGNLWTWFRRMKGMSLGTRIAYFPVALVGTCLMLYAYTAANRLLRSGKLDNLWFTTQTTLARPEATEIGIKTG